MTFIAGWLPSDLNNPSNDSIAGPDSVATKGPSGGFLVPAGATVSNIGFHSKNAVPAKFAIYALDFTLLAETGGATTGGAGDELIPLIADWTPQVDTYVYIAALTSSYLTGIGGDANLRFMPYASRAYADGFPNPFVQGGTANTPKQALWLDGTLAATGPSITTADNITTEGQTATFTLSGNTEAPTGATLNGTDVGALTDVGSGVYSYTAPLIADDATATLSVSVDATTADTTISYANSLPYALTAHAEPDANSVMFGNQFGSTGPVELAEPVLVSGDAAAATIDWAAMDSAQGWTADINTYATANEDGTQTWEFTYLIAETNQTGTFQRTFTVGDGVIVVTGGGRRVGIRPSIRSAVRAAISSAIHEG